jgi:hypothetical protein
VIIAGTGLDSFNDPEGITALYPFPGWEVAFVILGAALLIGWSVRQMLDENKEYDEAIRLYERVGMERAMNFTGSAHPGSFEDIEAVEAQVSETPDDAAKRDRRETG